jgi:hypothetical protein
VARILKIYCKEECNMCVEVVVVVVVVMMMIMIINMTPFEI